MSPERSKLLWITVAVSAFVLVVAIAGVFLFYPKNQAPAAPATVGNTAAPKPLDPQDYLNAPATAPTETKRNGDVIVIYGDKPQTVPPLGGSPDASATATNPNVTTTTTTTTIVPVPGSPADGSIGGQQPSAMPPASASPSGTPLASAPSQQGPVAPKSLAPSPAKNSAVAVKPATKAKVGAPTSTTAKSLAAKKPAAKPEPQYWIQTASFTERGKADNLRESLASNGIAALIAVKDISGKSWYRVRVGPYSSAKEAAGWLAKVKLIRGCDEAFVSTEASAKL